MGRHQPPKVLALLVMFSVLRLQMRLHLWSHLESNPMLLVKLLHSLLALQHLHLNLNNRHHQQAPVVFSLLAVPLPLIILNQVWEQIHPCLRLTSRLSLISTSLIRPLPRDSLLRFPLIRLIRVPLLFSEISRKLKEDFHATRLIKCLYDICLFIFPLLLFPFPLFPFLVEFPLTN